MTPAAFIQRIQDYYGPYPAGQRAIVAQYVGQRSDKALDFLFALTVKGFSSRYGKTPDVAYFEELRGAVIEELEAAGADLTVPAIEDQSERPLTEAESAQVSEALAMLGHKFGGAM